MDGKKFIEIKKPVEEVREIENKDLEQKKNESQGSKVIEKLEETILPTAHASDGDDLGLTQKDLTDEDKRNKRYTEETIGGGLTASYGVPVAGVAATGATAALGGITGLIGEATDNDGLKVAGDTCIESAKKPFENVGRATKGLGDGAKGIKKVFE